MRKTAPNLRVNAGEDLLAIGHSLARPYPKSLLQSSLMHPDMHSALQEAL